MFPSPPRHLVPHSRKLKLMGVMLYSPESHGWSCSELGFKTPSLCASLLFSSFTKSYIQWEWGASVSKLPGQLCYFKTEGGCAQKPLNTRPLGLVSAWHTAWASLGLPGPRRLLWSGSRVQSFPLIKEGAAAGKAFGKPGALLRMAKQPTGLGGGSSPWAA